MLTLFHRIKPMLVMVNALLFAVPQVSPSPHPFPYPFPYPYPYPYPYP